MSFGCEFWVVSFGVVCFGYGNGDVIECRYRDATPKESKKQIGARSLINIIPYLNRTEHEWECYRIEYYS